MKDNLNDNVSELLDCVEEYIPNKSFSIEEIESETSKSIINILKSIPFSNNVI